MSESNMEFITIQNKSALVHVCFVLLSFVCISAYANVYFKTTIIKQNIKIVLIAGVPRARRFRASLLLRLYLCALLM